MTREVTEQDFRKPEFRDAKVEDYEFRGDGAVVRKDRWETGIRQIASVFGMSRKEFEIPDIVEAVEKLKGDWTEAEPGEDPMHEFIDIKLASGDVLCRVSREDKTFSKDVSYYRWSLIGLSAAFHMDAFGEGILAWRKHVEVPE